ncbi:radical SAM protein [Chitinophaga filiformis]|uniref:radical SAM/SPASM domain-containing protein n=1 Tax=Chitinophaga filiformis TaxID=104663 RepID=UPI001F21522B|nr:radical SAM protein [Chitinophaga filiformis]MCF6402938.1 radical SAM protein [Chitinophaga filiformis]
MKKSQFNTSLVYENKNYIYNAFSNKFIAIDPTISDIFNAIRTPENIEELSEYHPTLYNSLCKNGFFVGDDVDEIQKVKDLSAKVDKNDTHFELIVNPTMNCNFKCWYCYESHVKGSKMNKETVNKTCSLIANIIESNPNLKSFHIAWFGGEPLMYYRDVIEPIMDFAEDFCAIHNIYLSCHMTTNGFLLTDEIIQSLKKYTITGLQITLDGNKETHNTVRYVSATRGSYDTIISNIVKLCENDFHVGIRVNYTATNMDGFEEVFDDLCAISNEKRHFATISFHKVWQVSDDKAMSERVRSLIRLVRDIGFVSSEGAVPDNVRHSCYADKINNATINYNGDVYKCTARNFAPDAKEGVLKDDGSIEWNSKFHTRMDIKFKNKPCLECPIMPLCNGGCSQHAIENAGKDYCVYDFDEEKKKEIVLKKLLNIIDKSNSNEYSHV